MAAPIEFYGGYQDYSDSGIDLTLLRENLGKPLNERWEGNRRVLDIIAAFQPAGQCRPVDPSGKLPMFNASNIVQLLIDHKVEFVLIDGLAMRLHGLAHLTENLGICYRQNRENLISLERAFALIHPYLRGAPRGLPFRFDAATIQAGLNFTLTTDLGAVDVLGEVSGIGGYDAVRARSEERTFHGFAVAVLSLDGLIDAKKAAGRAKDQLHLLELQELKKLRESDAAGQAGNESV